MANAVTVIAPWLFMIAFFYCFVFIDVEGKGKRSQAKRFFYRTIPNGIKDGLRKCCGDKPVWAIERTTSYVCFEANPAIQCFYLILAVGGYYLYVTHGFKHLPNDYASDIHTYIAWPLMGSCYWSYYKACFTDAGYLRKGVEKEKLERAINRYECDRIIFSNRGWCDTCEIPKPARSKHCSLCNACVEKMDHHCVWINSCVGLHNYKYFLLFLLLHTIICVYGVVIGYCCALHLIDKDDLWNKSY